MHPVKMLRVLFATKLGACGFCIRLSLLLSLASWAVFAGLVRWDPGSILAGLALVPVVGFTSLFAAHLVAYGVRVALGYRRVRPSGVAGKPDLSEERRRFLAMSLRVLGLALLPSVTASAVQGSTPGGDCQRPAGCETGRCCHKCKTRLKSCDPYYSYCVGYCGFPNCIAY